MGGPGSGRRADRERQRRAAQLRAEGLSMAQIGRELGVSRQAVYGLLVAAEARRRRGFVRCRACRAGICKMRQGLWLTRPALCLDCLAKVPAPPSASACGRSGWPRD